MYRKLVIGLVVAVLATVTAFGIAQTLKDVPEDTTNLDGTDDLVGEAEDLPDLPLLYFNSNTGTGRMGNIVINYGENLPANSFVKDNYVFVGWSETPEGEITYANEEVYLALESGAINTLYAIWTKNVENLWATSSPLFQEVWGSFIGDNIHRTIELVLAEEFVFAGQLTINATGKILIYSNEIPLAFEVNIDNVADYVTMLNLGSESDGITYSQFANSNIIVGNYFSIDKILANDCVLENGAYYTIDRSLLIRYVGTSSEPPETSFSIPSSVTEIGMNAFAETNLHSISVAPNSMLTRIGYGAFRDSATLSSLTIPNGVTHIGSYAFSGTGLNSFSLPTDLTNIGEFAFMDCPSLSSVTIPIGVNYLDHNAFYGCSSLSNISVATGNSSYKSLSGVLFDITEKEIILYPSGKSNTTYEIPSGTERIAGYAFAKNSVLSEITLPSSISSIGSYAFSGTQASISFSSSISLKALGEYAFSEYLGGSISLPDSITEIENHSFYNSPNLTSITLPYTLQTIGDYAFSGCTSLETFNIPDSVTVIGRYALNGLSCPIVFSETSTMTDFSEYAIAGYFGETFTIPKGITNLGIFVFSDSTSEIIFAGDTLMTSIGKFAFSGYSGSQIEIPASISYIGFGAFYNASNLTSIDIPASLTEIADYTFANCTSLLSIIIPENVTKIGEAAFSGCTSFSSLTIPKKVTEIGAYGVRGVTAEIIFNENPDITSIGDGAFSGYKGIEINIPSTITYLGKRSFENCTNIDIISIPESVKSIGMRAFENCYNLISISLPSQISAIAEGTFDNCKNLPSITIPDNVRSIDAAAFSLCRNLIWVNLGEESLLQNIGNWAFLGCNKLPSFTIPDKVNNLGYLAFYGCNSLTEITIPESVLDIGYLAFYGCNSLESIYMQSATPPTLGSSALSYNSTNRKVYVPVGSLDAYKSHNDWKYYKNSINEIGS